MIKKITIIILSLVCIFTLSGCGRKTYEEITYNDLTKLIENKEDFILFIGRTSCTHCDAYKVTLNKVIKKYHTDVKYIDTDKLTDDQNSELSANFPISGTPTTIFITKGKEKDTTNRIEGSRNYSEIVEAFKKNGYIK